MIDEIYLSSLGCLGKFKKKDLLSHLFTILVYLELFVLLLPAWSASPIWNYFGNTEKYFYVTVNGGQYVFLLFSVILLLLIKKIDKKLLCLLLIIDFFFILSLTFTGFQSGILAIIGAPVSFLFLFGAIRYINPSKTLFRPIIYILMAWSILPVILFVAVPQLRPAFFITLEGQLQTFGGFALHRNLYGMIIGIPIIILITYKLHLPFFIKLIFWPSCLIGVFLCASRTLFLAVLTCIFLDTFLRSKKIFLNRLPVLLVCCGIILVGAGIYNQYSIRPEKTNDDRKEIYGGFMQKIETSPILGEGKPTMYYSLNYPDGAPAHNFILQLAADYGLLIMLSFIVFLIYLYVVGERFTRMFLIYCIIWGLTQPYFGFAIPSSQVCIPIFIGFIMDHCK